MHLGGNLTGLVLRRERALGEPAQYSTSVQTSHSPSTAHLSRPPTHPVQYICPDLPLTQYSTSVQPSMVMHWNTVNMANMKLSKLVMPSLGPCQPSRHTVPFMEQVRPWPEMAHGAGLSSAMISTSPGRGEGDSIKG